VLADHLLGDRLPPGPFRAWVVNMMIDYLVSSVLEWLDVGDPELDDWWVEKATIGIRAAVTSWVLEDATWLPVTTPGAPLQR
ncbi:MAG TPA: hypothetical protein VJM33_15175, partial [Microthrixaceae bacterium]|nr:hypothetical protein [Microthrixaceae bacterium]